METRNHSVKTCVLRVNANCCTACRNNAKRKLQSVSGVSAVECNGEGLMTVSGEVNPMELLNKIKNWGKKAELVSVQNQPIVQTSSDESSNTSHQSPVLNDQQHPRKVESESPIKSFLLRCFGIKPTKTKVQPAPMRENRNWQFPAMAAPLQQQPAVYPPPQAIHGGLPPLPYPPPQATHGGLPPLPYPPPYFGSGQPPVLPPAMQHSAGMFQVHPPLSPPQFISRQPLPPHMVNPTVHYSHY